MTEKDIIRLFSKNLQRLLDQENMTQEELAYEVGISQQAISNYITGQNLPSFFMVVKISESLCCSLDDFII